MKQLRILIAAVLLLFAPQVRADEKTSLEYGVKAVVLFNFAKYVKWPDATFTAANQPIQVCLVGKSPVADKLNSAEAPTEAQGRPFAFKQISVGDLKAEAGKCQILYWMPSEQEAIEPLLPSLQQAHVLTVSDEKSDSAIISFTIENGKVRFIIRRKAAEAAGLELGSQLLKLAIVED